jgi:hypothetical protein
MSGCRLPIRLIPFGGDPVASERILREVELVAPTSFPEEAGSLLEELTPLLTSCPGGYLRRFLAWFGDWDEFIYSDNDVVATMNWEELFEHLPGFDLVHADEEYRTGGAYNYRQPAELERAFGKGALLSAFTAGHMLVKRDLRMVDDMRRAARWFRENPDIPLKHDQALLHVASLLGSWKALNLCRPPHNWGSSWAGDYGNTLAVVHRIAAGRRVSHIHYSGGHVRLSAPIEDFATAYLSSSQRTRALAGAALRELAGLPRIRHVCGRIRARVTEIPLASRSRRDP